MCFVSVKSTQQQATLMLHRVRDQLMRQRTATINALRGHLTEFGIVTRQRRGGVRQLLELVADAEDERIPPLARELLQTLVSHLRELEARIAELDGRLVKVAHSDPIARMLDEIPGVGPVIAPGWATAFAATVVDPGAFASGRHLSASIGLVPAQHASGGKQRHLGISKRGDGYLRRQLIHGARSLVWAAKHRTDGLSIWIKELLARRPFNVVVVAVANKLARIIWAMLARGEAYRAA
jgi:transposase